MKRVTLVVPGRLATRTGGFIYDRRIADGLGGRNWAVTVVELDPFVNPLSAPADTARAQFAGIPDGSLVLVDGLSFGSIPDVIEPHARRLRFVPIVHMMLSTAPGLSSGAASRLRDLEHRALKHARHVVITGERTRPHIQSALGHQDDSVVTHIPPGTDRVGIRTHESTGPPVRLLCVANVTPGKGHDILVRSLATVPVEAWTLRCAGSRERDPAFARDVEAAACGLGIGAHIGWLGELDDDALHREYERADVFVLPTRSETYGMAVAEAIAHGAPVVSTRTGDIPAITGEGGLLAECGDSQGFAEALARAIGDARVRRSLAAGARQAAAALPTWDAAAAAMEQVLLHVDERG